MKFILIFIFIFICCILVIESNVDVINVLLIGQENSGKSSLINQIAQTNLVNIDDKSLKINNYNFNPSTDYDLNYRINFMDTPGLYFNEFRTYHILNEIGQINNIDVIIVCIDLSEKLSDDNEIIKLLKTTYGINFIKKAIIVFTKVDIIPNNNIIAKKRYEGIITKKMPYLIADNSILANYKILQSIIETGRYSWNNKLPIPYELNTCYLGKCIKPKITLYYFGIKPDAHYKFLSKEENLEWEKIKNYVKYNMPYVITSEYICSSYDTNIGCSAARDNKRPVIFMYDGENYIFLTKITINFEKAINIINEHF